MSLEGDKVLLLVRGHPTLFWARVYLTASGTDNARGPHGRNLSWAREMTVLISPDGRQEDLNGEGVDVGV